MRLTDEELEQLADLEKAAIPKKWVVKKSIKNYRIIYEDGRGIIGPNWPLVLDDACLIAALRNAAPALIAEVREAREKLEQLRELASDRQGFIMGGPTYFLSSITQILGDEDEN